MAGRRYVMRIARFRSPELALLTAMLAAHPAVAAPALAAEAAPQQAQQPAPAETKPALPAQPPAGLIAGLSLQNVNLLEVVDFLARQLKINYVVDKGVSGAVTLNTYGEIRDIDPRALLDTILRINGAAMVQTGNIYRIVPLADLARMPLPPEVDAKDIPEDDRPILNLVFLKYANVEELAKLIGEFLGPQGRAWAYPPANLLLVLDSRRSMKRTMEMIALFDSDVLAKQRVKLFDIRNSRPSDLAKELEGLLKSMSLSKELASVKFVPVDRINTLIAVAPNPGVFDQIQEWIGRLDVKVKSAAGKIDTYVYRVKYGKAPMLAQSIMMLYSQMYPGFGMGAYGMGAYGMGMAPFGAGGAYGMPGMGGYGMGMYPGMGGYGMGMYPGMGGYGMGAYGATGGAAVQPAAGQAGAAGAASAQAMQAGMGTDLTGGYLGMGGLGFWGPRSPRVVPNLTDNSLLILATPEEYESILRLLRELDIPPRQVLIEAKIFELQLTGALSWGLDWFLKNRGSSAPGSHSLTGQFTQSTMSLSTGWLLRQSKELLAALSTSELSTKARVVSTPSVVATDSIPASINVGLEVPMLTAQAVTGVQQGGSSLFANTITNRKTGVNLSITANVNPSGVVTLVINQEVSSPGPPPVGGIQSPSFSNRNVSTQVTVQDGDTIAIGGIISENNSQTSGGIPFLHRIPGLGAAFGNRSYSRERTELLVFITPRVIYDTNELTDASDELVQQMRRLQKIMR
ncbi:MAG: type II secretion system secretin GspD [Bryobacteraceae bacterium]|nr:type II secretion system secretin GspD [Bryobacteraceae bacterium]